MGREPSRKAQTLPSGLYVIADSALTPPARMVESVEQVIQGGARMLQYRDKSTDQTLRHKQAATLLKLCDQYDVPFIINDDVELARAVGARGVHLGRDDTPIVEARAVLGNDAIIGASCYNDLARATRAWEKGANYVAFGSFFPSPTKPEATTADLDTLRRASHRLAIPVCAIGGITLNNAPSLLRAGASLLAVISGVFAQPDPRAAAEKFAALFDSDH